MDLEKTLAFATQYLSEYSDAFVATLTRPSARFAPLAASAETTVVVSPSREDERKATRLSPKLFTFVVISIFLGTTVNALIPNRLEGPGFSESAVIIVLSWFAFSTMAHWLAKLLGGHGSYAQTLSVSLQLLAVIYVVSCFTALVAGGLTRLPVVQQFAVWAGPSAEFVVSQPVTVYFVAQCLLMVIYLPLALRWVHGFGWFRQLVLGVLAPVATAFSVLFFLGFGVMHAPPP